MNKKLVLGLDFNNLLFGSYYGQPLINSSGLNVNAIKGFFFKLKTYKEIFNPDLIVCANDVTREGTFRRKLYKEYKAQRKPHDEDIIKQLKYAQRIVALLGYPIINNALYEADDMLGMISRLVEDNNMQMIIASSDRDMYQLITDNTFILNPRNMEIIDKSYMEQNYKLTPEQWIELKMLQGDPSDNIPGIKGIGNITALQLMQQHGSIENIYNHLSSVKPSIRGLLLNGQKDLSLMKELVTIVTDYKAIGLTMEDIQPFDRYEEEIINILYELELNSLVNVMLYTLFKDKENDYDSNQTNQTASSND